MDTVTEIRSETVRFRLYPSTMERLRKIAQRERITLTQVMQRACEQISDQGYTDKIIIKGKI